MTLKEYFFYTALALGITIGLSFVVSPEAEIWKDKRGDTIGYRCSATDWNVVPMSDKRCLGAVQNGHWTTVVVDTEQPNR